MTLHRLHNLSLVAHDNDSRIAGAIYCLVAACGFTIMNIALRAASATDASVAAGMRAMVPALILLPFVLSRRFLRPSRPLAMITAASILVQGGGNLLFQQSLIWSGVVVTVPIVFAAMPLAAAVLGWFWLAERPSRVYLLALGALILSVVLMGAGHPSGPALQLASGLWWLGLAAAIVAAVSYAIFLATIKQVTKRGLEITDVALVNSLVGTVLLGTIAIGRLGIVQTHIEVVQHWVPLVLAGLMNLGSFLLLAHGLQLVGVAYGTLFNSCQVALTAAAGMMMFREPASTPLFIGILLTCVALIVASWGQRPERSTASSRHTIHHIPPLTLQPVLVDDTFQSRYDNGRLRSSSVDSPARFN